MPNDAPANAPAIHLMHGALDNRFALPIEFGYRSLDYGLHRGPASVRRIKHESGIVPIEEPGTAAQKAIVPEARTRVCRKPQRCDLGSA